MTALEVTAVLKTDIKGSTPTFRSLIESDLAPLLVSHREFVTRVASARGGRIVKPEGDGFWIAFRSVTAAALAAIEMQEELQLAQPNKGDDRLAMRIVITLGDVLSPDGAMIGDAVVLAARIEAITPPDEIYLSAAARLAMNPGEVRTTLVDSFALKGFPEPVPVYRVEQRYRTQILKDQYIVITELRRLFASAKSSPSPVSTVERTFDQLLELVGHVCREFSGTSRFSSGDSHCLSFPEGGLALAAAQRLAEQWSDFEREGIGCSMNVVVHKGTLFAYRSYFWGGDLSIAVALEDATHNLETDGPSVFISEEVHRDLIGTQWLERLEPARANFRVERASTESLRRRAASIALYRLEGRDHSA